MARDARDRICENAYLLFADAAGYSTIVRHNPRDRAARAFDLVRERIAARVTTIAAARRCEQAQLWSWRGDGGFFVVHDADESVAAVVAVEAGAALVDLDLCHLRDEFGQLGLDGTLHLRVAVHKGTVRVPGNGNTGTVHSPDLNFAAHLERAVPPDCLAVSEDVLPVCGELQGRLRKVGQFEGKEVYLLPGRGYPIDAAAAWLAATGLDGGMPVHGLHERPSQQQKARLVDAARTEVVDLGTALRTASHYLVTTERPAHYREAVLRLLHRGGHYRAVVLNPDSKIAMLMSELRDEDLIGKAKGSLEEFAQFHARHPEVAERIRVYQTTAFIDFGCLAIDPESRSSLLLYAPYLPNPVAGGVIQRGDMPHYLVSPTAGALFEKLRHAVRSSYADEVVTRVL
ncbi:MAG: hypothetical protein ACRDRV_11030 [Pseudonocardiaceae bacterium]